MKVENTVLGVLCLCLFIGGITHVIENVNHGFLPYKFAPTWINVYWSALAVIDLLAVYLLLTKRNPGLVLTFMIMTTDVIINSYSLYVLEIIHEFWRLQLQSMFLGYVLAANVILWKSKNDSKDSAIG